MSTGLQQFLDELESWTFDGEFNALMESRTCKQKLHVPIYIPSKGRGDSAKTPKTLDKLGLSYTIVVEPQDEEAYRKGFPDATIEVMDKSNQGIYYVRNYIKDLSTSKDEPHHWAIDDDISHFYDRHGPKRVQITSDFPFQACQELMLKWDTIGQFGLVHDAFAFTRKTPYSLNKQVCSVMLINNRYNHLFKFRDKIIEDTDFSLQMLFANLSTVTLNKFSYLAPAQLKQKGGNTEDFLNNKLYERQKALCEEYRPWFTMKVEENKSRIMPSKVWSKFNQLPRG